jgi:hypothetical protein
VKQIITKFRVGKTQLYESLKTTPGIKYEWLIHNGSMK